MNARIKVGGFGFVTLGTVMSLVYFYTIGGGNSIDPIIRWIWYMWAFWALVHYVIMVVGIKTYVTLAGAFTCMALILWATIFGPYDLFQELNHGLNDAAIMAVSTWNIFLILDAFFMNSWGKEKETEEETVENEATTPTQEN